MPASPVMVSVPEWRRHQHSKEQLQFGLASFCSLKPKCVQGRRVSGAGYVLVIVSYWLGIQELSSKAGARSSANNFSSTSTTNTTVCNRQAVGDQVIKLEN